MAERTTIDVSGIIEQQKLGRFLIGLVLISWIITFFDGLDSNLISFALLVIILVLRPAGILGHRSYAA